MLKYSARQFFWCGGVLRTITTDCYMGSAVCIQGEPGFNMGRILDGFAKEKALAMLPDVVKAFNEIGLVLSAQTTQELLDALESDSVRTFEWLHAQARGLESLAEKELSNRCFLYVAPERAKFWPTHSAPHLFGKDVADCFPSAAFDIESAGMCLAASLSTAAVCHLMRVLEVGLSVLGARFHVSVAHTNWAPALAEIEKQVRVMQNDPAWRALPDFKEQQEFYSQVASHFVVLKDAWRNYTMHTRGRHSEPEAVLIFENVKGFMQKLATRLKE